VVKTSSVGEKKGECEEDEKNTPLVPLNQWSPNALQSLTVLCMVEKCYMLDSWVTKRNSESGLLVKTAASPWQSQNQLLH